MDNKINNLQNENETVNRPSKSGAAGSSPAGPTKNKGVNVSDVGPATPSDDGRESLNAGRTLAGISMDDERWTEAYAVLERLHQSGCALALRRERGPLEISPEGACSELQAIFWGGAR